MTIKIREPVNAITHLFGALLSVVGLGLLLNAAVSSGEMTKIISSIIFSLGLIGLYTTSAVYHGIHRYIPLFRKLDHTMIYFLIAASYTPICLVTLRGRTGGIFLGIIWSMAVLGGVLKFLWLSAPRWLYTSFYLILGWAALFILIPLYRELPFTAIELLVGGGLFYTLGAVIYGTKSRRLRIGVFGFHEIFHIFILLGSLSHYIMIYRYVIAAN
ncbi:MAG: hemolysin [delta proteobacterium ML8_F1]|nr:MAG: hemolysin [delta proteobacterium ML8_F1]